MAKNDNPHAIRLADSLKKFGKHSEALCFFKNHPLSKAATAEKKFEWAQHQCAFLSAHFDQETIQDIRMDCACGPELGKGKKLKDIYEKEKDIRVFVEKANALHLGFSLQQDGESLSLIYPQCYCSCVKRISAPLPAVWCYCTLRYTKRLFAYVFGKEVQVELLSSIKQGDPVCRIRIGLLEKPE